MTYDLYSGDRAFSSWSLRGWLMLEKLACLTRLILWGSMRAQWPKTLRHSRLRALARSMTSEMHAGFPALRGTCPMQLFHQSVGFEASAAALAELERLELLFIHAKELASDGPWLFGAYSVADVFYAPLMARIAGYGLPVGTDIAAYMATTLADPAFVAWRKEGITVSYDPFPYPQGLPKADWPSFSS